MKPWIRSVVAIVAGFLITAAASIATDAIMHATGIFPSSPRTMSDPLFVFASAYRRAIHRGWRFRDGSFSA